MEEIKHMTVPRLFQGLSTARKTGTAVFKKTGSTAEVRFRDGDMVFASSKPEVEGLAAGLARSGTITTAQFEASAELAKKTSRRQEAILVELGFVTPADLVEGERDQVKQTILSLFLWKDGSFEFQEGNIPRDEILPLRVSTGNLILAGIELIDWKTVKKALPHLTTVLRPGRDVSALFQDVALSPEQKEVLLLVNGKRTIEEICADSGIGDFNTLKTLYAFLTLRMAEEGAISTEEDAAQAREAVHAAVSEIPAKPETGAPEAVRDELERAYEEMEKQDYYQALGLTRACTPGEIKKAYFRLSKRYHPDRHFDQDLGDMKQKLEALFIGINKAYTTLSSAEARAAYDQAMAPGGKEKAEEKARQETAERAKIQFARGLEEYLTGNYWAALELFEWASRLCPDNADFAYYHGMCLMQFPRRWPESGEWFRKAVELDPAKAAHHIGLGNFHLKSGNKADASAAFKEALKRDPGSKSAREGIVSSGT
jgi:tetratricopeptide (TPR) repeat protein